jgi:hypothetical protein
LPRARVREKKMMTEDPIVEQKVAKVMRRRIEEDFSARKSGVRLTPRPGLTEDGVRKKITDEVAIARQLASAAQVVQQEAPAHVCYRNRRWRRRWRKGVHVWHAVSSLRVSVDALTKAVKRAYKRQKRTVAA